MSTYVISSTIWWKGLYDAQIIAGHFGIKLCNKPFNGKTLYVDMEPNRVFAMDVNYIVPFCHKWG